MTEYERSKELTNTVHDMVSDAGMAEFNDLRQQELSIECLLEVRENSKGEPLALNGAPPVRAVKIPPVYHLLTKSHYVVLANEDWWKHANEIQQKAALHHALMTIKVEVTDKGAIVLTRRKPDVIAFTETVSHFGAWNATLIDFKDAFKMSAKQFAENMKAEV